MGTCNMRCAYCANQTFAVQEYDTIRSMEDIFNDISKEETAVRVECRGEITLYPVVMEYLVRKGKEGYNIEILSNGLLLDQVLAPDDPVQVVLSLDGHTAKMNRLRRLTQKRVDHILQNVFTFSSEIQCVFAKQTVNEMNAFIQFLLDNDFHEFLHIFPCSENGKITTFFDRSLLLDVPFIPDSDYFQRWRFIYDYHYRNFECDFYNNGYTYYIHNTNKYMMKCDCVPEAVNMIRPYSTELDISNHDCRCCINHYEYNDKRKIMHY